MARTKCTKKAIPKGAIELFGDSIIQLKDGRLIFYNLKKNGKVIIYNQNTFQEILSINLIEILEEEILNESEKKDIDYYDELELRTKISIKQLNNELILIAFNKYIFEINLLENNFEHKIYKKEKIILELNELSEQKIIIFTEDNIEILIKEKNEYIVSKIYDINKNWKIIPMAVQKNDKTYKYFYQCYFSYILPNEKLLLNSFSFETSYKDFPSHNPKEFTHSKIIFIDLKNFGEIQSTKEFKKEAKFFVLKDYVVVQGEDKIYIYDINKLYLIKELNYEYNNFLYKYSNDLLIGASIYEQENNFLVFHIEENDFIHTCTIKTNFKFYERYINGDRVLKYNNKILFTLNDKRVILLCDQCAYILLQLDLEL